MTEDEELARFRRRVRSGPGTLRWVFTAGIEGLAADAVVELIFLCFGTAAGIVADVLFAIFFWTAYLRRARRR